MAATCGLCLRLFGENANSLADLLIVVLIMGYWAIEMAWIVRESVKEYPPDDVLLGLSRFPETLGCALLFTTSWLSTLQDANAKAAFKLVGLAVPAYATALFAVGFLPESEFLLSIADVPYVREYWYELCCYGALCAVLMDVSARGALLMAGILTSMMSIRPPPEITDLVSSNYLIWFRIVSVPLLCGAVSMYRAVGSATTNHEGARAKKTQ